MKDIKKFIFTVVFVFLFTTTACAKTCETVSKKDLTTNKNIVAVVKYDSMIEINDPTHMKESESEQILFYNQISDNITDSERDMLAKLVFLEARDQSFLGQRAVIEVVFNRVLSDEFPNTITDVIYQKNQFTPAYLISSTTPTQEQYDAVDAVLNELYPVLDKGVVFFAMSQYNKYLYEKIGDHYFCYSQKSYKEQKGC